MHKAKPQLYHMKSMSRNCIATIPLSNTVFSVHFFKLDGDVFSTGAFTGVEPVFLHLSSVVVPPSRK